MFNDYRVNIDGMTTLCDNKSAIDIINSKHVDISGFEFDFEKADAIRINGSVSESIQIKAMSANVKDFTQIGEEVSENTVKF